jgi:predicted ATPase
MLNRSQVSRVVLTNYKSIKHCDVILGPLTFLVGPNGAGKSNFVEAIRFLSYALSGSLEQAVENRGGFQSIAHRGDEIASTITFQLLLDLAEVGKAQYDVEIRAVEDGPAVVAAEGCSVDRPSGREWFRVEEGVVSGSNRGVMPTASEDKLYLVNASGLAPFEPVYRALSNITVYNPLPEEIRGFKSAKRYRNLDRSGSALAEIISKMKDAAPDRLARVYDYLERINPNVMGVDPVSVDANFNLRFKLKRGNGHSQDFLANNISDGTLRALAVLVALFQNSDRYPLNFIGLEEPEAGLHPAAAGVLFDSLVEGSTMRQIVVTSHSPDLLDREDIPVGALKAVTMKSGCTIIGEVDQAARTALRERLYTVGELMRMGQLRPENPNSIGGIV